MSICVIIQYMITVLIPTYNEKNNITTLVDRIFDLKIPYLKIIFIDDNSNDGTTEIIKNLQKKYPIELISRKNKLGLGSAYIAGFKKVLTTDYSKYIFEMDADLSHAPKDILKLLKACEEGADLSIGSRKIKGGKIVGWSFRRHLMSNIAMKIAKLCLKLKTQDVTSGFRCYKREVLEKINLDKINSNGYAFQEEMLFKIEKLNFKVVEIPVTFNDRQHGKSKLSYKDIIEFFIVMCKLRYE